MNEWAAGTSQGHLSHLNALSMRLVRKGYLGLMTTPQRGECGSISPHPSNKMKLWWGQPDRTKAEWRQIEKDKFEGPFSEGFSPLGIREA